eukprot:Hpha_TRINITY_DN9888_c0_g1::TRINITY_DN9888_c0_g1_i1::g.81339::m.81339
MSGQGRRPSGALERLGKAQPGTRNVLSPLPSFPTSLLPVLAFPVVIAFLVVSAVACVPMFIASLIGGAVFFLLLVPAFLVWGGCRIKGGDLNFQGLHRLWKVVGRAPGEALALLLASGTAAALVMLALVVGMFVLSPATCCASAGLATASLLFFPITYSACFVVCGAIAWETSVSEGVLATLRLRLPSSPQKGTDNDPTPLAIPHATAPLPHPPVA